jgi:hypothetical protein
MKNIFLLTFTMVFAVNFSYAQWATSGSDIYNTNTGNVGIGTNPPTYAGYGVLALNGKTPSQGGYLSMMMNGTEVGALVANTQFNFQTASGIVTQFYTGSNPTLQISSAGNVGIGLLNPATTLSVNGTTRLGGGMDYGTTAVFSLAPGTVTFDAPGVSGGRLFVSGTTGNIGIGTTTPHTKLTVNGTIHTKEVIVDMNIFPDYVFKPSYHLPTLTEVKTYIDQNHHLAGMPTEAEVVKNGLKVGETEALLTKKVEELTLYLIEKDSETK